jgi:hypothetical protein
MVDFQTRPKVPTANEWAELEGMMTALFPFKIAQEFLGDNKYVSSSWVAYYAISKLQQKLGECARNNTHIVAMDMAQRMLADFEDCWGSKQCQPEIPPTGPMWCAQQTSSWDSSCSLVLLLSGFSF